MARLLVAAALTVGLAGCGPQWSLPLAALDRVPLSVTEPAPGPGPARGGARGPAGDRPRLA